MRELISRKPLEIKLEIVGYPSYVVAGNKVFNRKRLKYKRPTNFDCPF